MMQLRILDHILYILAWVNSQIIATDTALLSRRGLTITLLVIGILTVLLIVLSAARFIAFLRAQENP